MRLILVRHGETDWNRLHLIQGQHNIPLNEVGKTQAKSIALALKEEKVEAIYSSTLQRALETAEEIKRFHQVNIEHLDGLMELDVGKLDGMNGLEVKTRYPEFFRLWESDAALAQLPGGESLTELQNRVWSSIQGVIARNHNDPIIVVGHFFVILSILCKVLDIPFLEFRRFGMDVGSISILEFNGNKAKLVSFNDTCHLGPQ